MTFSATLRINMTGLREDPAEESERYRAVLDMAEYAEEQGFTTINVEEHHVAENGWLPSPLILAGMILARTRRIHVSITALIVPLYDPIKLAEDIAVLDLASGGRFLFTAGLGYRPIEYHATGRNWKTRGRDFDAAIETMLQAWSGEAFEYRGETIRVTPIPRTRPHPFFSIGGSSPAGARRAARFGLPFLPAVSEPSINQVYLDECAARSTSPMLLDPGAANSMLIVDQAPERAWQELAPFLCRELNEYSSWKDATVARPGEERVDSVADLQAQGRFKIETPEAVLDTIERGERASAVVHPLVGGVDLDRAWSILRNFADGVLRPAQERTRPNR